MWADLPIRGPSTFAFGNPSGIPWKTEQVPSSGNNISTQITSSWHECAWWWTHFPASGPLPVHDGRTWVQGPSFQAVIQHLMSLTHAPLWHLLPKWRVKSAWPGRSVRPSIAGSSGHLLFKHQGIPTPKRPVSKALGAPSSLGLEGSGQTHGHLLSGITMVQVFQMMQSQDNQTLDEIYAPPSLLIKTPGPGAMASSPEMWFSSKRRQTGH